MMSAKFKLFAILILSIFATAGAGVYITQQQPSVPVLESSKAPQQLSIPVQSQDIDVYPERSKYQTIPLESINSALQGSDPANLALNAFDISSEGNKPVIEVFYPQQNQALVTITQIKQANSSVDTIKYRVEMTSFGRSLLVSSPPVWQIVWAGSQKECKAGSKNRKNSTQNCH
jgi:hypothetical protein